MPIKIPYVMTHPKSIDRIPLGNDDESLEFELEYFPHPGPPGLILSTKFLRVFSSSFGVKYAAISQILVVKIAPKEVFCQSSRFGMKKLNINAITKEATIAIISV